MPDVLSLIAINYLHQELGGLGGKLARALEDARCSVLLSAMVHINGPRLQQHPPE
jgi:hypothetical protein